MNVETSVSINAPKEAVWAAITDFENAVERIKAIEEIEILERPESGWVGFKWRETRTMFGKTATEEMWITDALEGAFYKTRAESHGSVYISTLTVAPAGDGCTLTMGFEGIPQGCLTKVMAIPMGLLVKGMMRKACHADLEDIKAAVEKGSEEPG